MVIHPYMAVSPQQHSLYTLVTVTMVTTATVTMVTAANTKLFLHKKVPNLYQAPGAI